MRLIASKRWSVAASMLAATVLTAPAAVAVPVETGTWSFSQADEGLTDYCPHDDYASLTIDRVSDYDATYAVKTHSTDEGFYWERLHYKVLRTNPLNGKQLNTDGVQITKDQKITDNGDGTITIETRALYTESNTDAAGNVVARVSGPQWFVVVIDLNGTPDDGEDDFEVSFDSPKHVGLNADLDWCAFVHESLE